MEPTPHAPPRSRRDPRALLCARALVETEGAKASEHLTYDLSAGGVRLCGIPRARVGDRVSLVLQLPAEWVHADGRLLRVARDPRRPEFAIRFEGLDAASEDAIQDAVVDALSHPERPSVLVIHAPEAPDWRCWGWLAPVSPICLAATTPLQALQRFQEHDISLALVGTPPAAPFRALHWAEAIPEATWRSIDADGRLGSLHAALTARDSR